MAQPVGNYTYVSTAQQLQNAVQQGSRDIMVLEHLDLSTIGVLPIEGCDCSSHLGSLHPWTRVIRGNCTNDDSLTQISFPGPALLPRRNNQCVISVSSDTLHMAQSNAWLDNLYFRARSSRAAPAPVVLTADDGARVWMTNITIQGDGDMDSKAMHAMTADGVHYQGCTFGHMGGENGVIDTLATPLSFHHCDFRNVLTLGGANDVVGVVHTSSAVAPLLFEQSTLEESDSLCAVVRGGGLVYSDDDNLKAFDADFNTVVDGFTLADLPSGMFLDAETDPWFLSSTQELGWILDGSSADSAIAITPQDTAEAPLATSSTEVAQGARSSDAPDDLPIPTWQFVGLMASIAVLLLLICSAVTVIRQCGKRRAQNSGKKNIFGAHAYARATPPVSSIFVNPNGEDTESLVLDKLAVTHKLAPKATKHVEASGMFQKASGNGDAISSMHDEYEAAMLGEFKDVEIYQEMHAAHASESAHAYVAPKPPLMPAANKAKDPVRVVRGSEQKQPSLHDPNARVWSLGAHTDTSLTSAGGSFPDDGMQRVAAEEAASLPASAAAEVAAGAASAAPAAAAAVAEVPVAAAAARAAATPHTPPPTSRKHSRSPPLPSPPKPPSTGSPATTTFQPQPNARSNRDPILPSLACHDTDEDDMHSPSKDSSCISGRLTARTDISAATNTPLLPGTFALSNNPLAVNYASDNERHVFDSSVMSDTQASELGGVSQTSKGGLRGSENPPAQRDTTAAHAQPMHVLHTSRSNYRVHDSLISSASEASVKHASAMSSLSTRHTRLHSVHALRTPRAEASGTPEASSASGAVFGAPRRGVYGVGSTGGLSHISGSSPISRGLEQYTSNPGERHHNNPHATPQSNPNPHPQQCKQTSPSNGSSSRSAGGGASCMGGSLWTREFVNSAFSASGFALGTDTSEKFSAPPNANLPFEDQVAWVHHQLDGFDDSRPFFKRFESLGPTNRRQGGSGIVQFVREFSSGREFAAKFFVDHDAFTVERHAYTNSPLRPFLPDGEVFCNDAYVDSNGHALPPCIVTERGETLVDTKPDLVSSVAVLANLAAYIHAMHAIGYVHRNFKPSNIVWLPRANKWVSLDVSNATRTGKAELLNVALAYAAPEVVEALERNRKLVAAPAQDMWALGVIGFELFTGSAAFPLPFVSRDEVLSQLRGERPLPWAEASRSPDARARMGPMHAPLMQLLNRDPKKRPDAAFFRNQCMAISASSTTVLVNEIRVAGSEHLSHGSLSDGDSLEL